MDTSVTTENIRETGWDGTMMVDKKNQHQGGSSGDMPTKAQGPEIAIVEGESPLPDRALDKETHESRQEELIGGLPISKPIAISRSRRSSHSHGESSVSSHYELGAASASHSRSPSSVQWSDMVQLQNDTDGDDEAAERMSSEEPALSPASTEAEFRHRLLMRHLRRTTWPPRNIPTITDSSHVRINQDVDDEDASSPHRRYQETPATTPAQSPRRQIDRAHTTQRQAIVEQQQSQQLVGSASVTSNVPSQVSVVPTAPLPETVTNIVLLGDETCGLGAALDPFAGRDRNIGVSFKTRKVKVQSYDGRVILHRVRCWHTPSLHPSTTPTLAPFLRGVAAICLVYDEMSDRSLDACKQWAKKIVAQAKLEWKEQQRVVMKSTQQISADIAHPNRRPILVIGNTARMHEHDRQHYSQPPPEDDDHEHLPEMAAASVKLRRPLRRSSLPHACVTGPRHLLHSQPTMVNEPTLSMHLTSFPSSFTPPTVTPARPVSDSSVRSLLSYFERHYTHASHQPPVAHIRIDANRWEERYRAFNAIANMVQTERDRDKDRQTHMQMQPAYAPVQPQAEQRRNADTGTVTDRHHPRSPATVQPPSSVPMQMPSSDNGAGLP